MVLHIVTNLRTNKKNYIYQKSSSTAFHESKRQSGQQITIRTIAGIIIQMDLSEIPLDTGTSMHKEQRANWKKAISIHISMAINTIIEVQRVVMGSHLKRLAVQHR